MCIPREALASGLMLRIERDGYVPAKAELAALLRVGCSREELRRALVERGAARPDRPFAEVIAVLDRMS